MLLSRRIHNQRSGKVVIALLALFAIPLMGMVAFAVDMGWMVATQSNLQNAADSAALAGAGQLMDGWVQYHLPGQTQKADILKAAQDRARTYAKQFAAANGGGLAGAHSVVSNW